MLVKELQATLVDLFHAHGLDVGVGITKDGICILSQDPRVDAHNIGEVVPYKAMKNEQAVASDESS